MSDLSEVKRLQEKREKRNMEQLEAVMQSIVKHYKNSMKVATLNNQSTLELKVNLEFKDSFDPEFIKHFDQTKAYDQVIKDCQKNNIELSMRLKGSVLVIKSKW